MGPGTGQGSPSRTTPMDTLRALAGDITDFLTNRVEMVRANAPEMPSGTGRDRMDAIANRTPEEARAAYDAIWNNPFFGPMVMGIKAYHGSPHDFDKFDLSKIGTGEGAQAYGHGGYFTENEGVAKFYRDKLTPDHRRLTRVDDRIAANAGMIAQLRGELASATPDSPEAVKLAQRLEFFEQSNKRLTDGLGGRMYEVDINTTPDRLLDWDKPLSEQSAHVQSVLRGFGLEHRFPGTIRPVENGFVVDYVGSDGTTRASRVFKSEDDARRAMDATAQMRGRNPTGGEIYESSRIVGGNKRVPPLATDALRNAGIDGIQYLDQGSRGAGVGTKNLVVFDDSLINILRKYGILAPLMGAGAMEAVGGGPEEQ